MGIARLMGGANYGADLSRPAEGVYWLEATNDFATLTQRERVAGTATAK